MAQILVRNLVPAVVETLKQRASRAGRSLQSEVRIIIESAANEPVPDPAAFLKKIDALRKRFKGRVFSDSAEMIREDRDR
jgi:antitoxin FitA